MLGDVVILLGRITVILVTVDLMVDSWLPCMKFYNIDLGIKGVMLLFFFQQYFSCIVSGVKKNHREARLFIFQDLIIGKVLFIFIYLIFFRLKPFE